MMCVKLPHSASSQENPAMWQTHEQKSSTFFRQDSCPALPKETPTPQEMFSGEKNTNFSISWADRNSRKSWNKHFCQDLDETEAELWGEQRSMAGNVLQVSFFNEFLVFVVMYLSSVGQPSLKMAIVFITNFCKRKKLESAFLAKFSACTRNLSSNSKTSKQKLLPKQH